MNSLQLAEYKMEGGQVLTGETVKNYLVSGNGAVTDQEALMFIELCKAQKLNPFIREAYLIKFGSTPAQIVVGKDVFIKRAYNNPNFEGLRAGIVTIDKDGNMKEIEGSLKGMNERLVGGWCEVYVKGMKFPIKSKVSMEEYSKGQSTWKQMPMVMIRKCAMVTALREAFPEDLQGLYDASEMGVDTKLPEKEIKVGMASIQQKNKILAMAAQKDLFSFDTKKDTSKLEEFCNSNGYNLHKLTFKEADELLQLLIEYDPVIDIVEADEVEYQDVEDEINTFDVAEGQVVFQ